MNKLWGKKSAHTNKKNWEDTTQYVCADMRAAKIL